MNGRDRWRSLTQRSPTAQRRRALRQANAALGWMRIGSDAFAVRRGLMGRRDFRVERFALRRQDAVFADLKADFFVVNKAQPGVILFAKARTDNESAGQLK